MLQPPLLISSSRELEADLVPEWRTKYLNYKACSRMFFTVDSFRRRIFLRLTSISARQEEVESHHAGIPKCGAPMDTRPRAAQSFFQA
jgi:hypothetical protein